mgnify:CR=1 FL=1
MSNWTEVKISVNSKDVDRAGDIASMVVPYGIYIEDYSELEKEAWEIAHIDLIDEDLLAKDRSKAIVHVYISPEENPMEAVAFLRERYTAENIESEIMLNECRNEDWENNWKQYYKPMEIGERLIVIPEWEKAKIGDRVPLILNPGLTFGTGSHATTRLCLTALEKTVQSGDRVLDLGCGSGILSIAALLLGANHAFACDIDEKCLTVAYENAELNGIGKDRYTVCAGNVLTDGNILRQAAESDLVLANIVADVIIGLAPAVGAFLKKGGLFLTSGIIDTRAMEVKGHLLEAGWDIVEENVSEDWYSFLCR